MARFQIVSDSSCDLGRERAERLGVDFQGQVLVPERLEVDEGAEVQLFIMFDSTGEWIAVNGTLEGGVKRSYTLPIVPRRGDHYRIKLEGHGGCRVYSLAREYYDGSSLKSLPGRQ